MRQRDGEDFLVGGNGPDKFKWDKCNDMSDSIGDAIKQVDWMEDREKAMLQENFNIMCNTLSNDPIYFSMQQFKNLIQLPRWLAFFDEVDGLFS